MGAQTLDRSGKSKYVKQLLLFNVTRSYIRQTLHWQIDNLIASVLLPSDSLHKKTTYTTIDFVLAFLWFTVFYDAIIHRDGKISVAQVAYPIHIICQK